MGLSPVFSGESGKTLKWLTAMIIIPMLLAGGCRWIPFARPEPRARKLDTEPTITLYLTEEDERVSLKFEEYVAGVVAAEMSPNWPEEALRAQAILARTFAWRKIQQGGEEERYGTDASDDIESFQAYNASLVNERVRRAVSRSRGKVLVYRGGLPLTWFHAASGGRTATAEEGLAFTDEPTPYITSVKEPTGADLVPWEATFSGEELVSALSELGYDMTRVENVRIGRRGPSGRALALVINGKEVPAPSLRIALDSTRMRSTLLESVRLTGGGLTLAGRGYGHGVGLSQNGAKALALKGQTAEEILRHYYRRVTVEKLWD